jgi:menaquinone-dependent protoporphyrinogen oxidase
MRLLIVYGTTEGHTRKIAQFLKDEAEKKGINVTLCDASNEPEPPLFFNGVIVCSSIHIQKYQASVAHYVMTYSDKLNAVPLAFCSVSLTAAGDEEKSWEELKKITVEFLHSTKWTPQFTEYVAGALLFTKYDFFKKYIMRMIAKKAGGNTDTSDDYVYTDWKKLSVFANAFVAEMEKQKDKVSVEEVYL